MEFWHNSLIKSKLFLPFWPLTLCFWLSLSKLFVLVVLIFKFYGRIVIFTAPWAVWMSRIFEESFRSKFVEFLSNCPDLLDLNV